MGLKRKDQVIVVLLIVLAVVVFIGGRNHDNNVTFTTEKWVSAVGNDRQKILQNLRDRTQFVGMKTEEVKELLGEPEEETETFLNYYVGIPQGLFGTKVDTEEEYFLLTLEDDIIVKTEVVIPDLLPKESMYRVIGEATEDAMLYPEEAKK